MIIISTVIFMIKKHPEGEFNAKPRKPVLDLAPITIFKADPHMAMARELCLDLNPFISALTGEWDDIMQRKGIIFTVFCDPKIQHPVALDQQALTLILNRLIGRAAQTTTAGRIHVHITEKRAPHGQSPSETLQTPTGEQDADLEDGDLEGTDLEGTDLEIVIADTGNGRITSDALALDGTVNDFSLQDIQPQLDIISGRIMHKSRLGRGAEFILTLPLKHIQAQSFQHLTLPDTSEMVKLKLEKYHSLEAEDAVAGLKAQAKIIADNEQQAAQGPDSEPNSDSNNIAEMPLETLSEIISLSSHEKIASKAVMDGLIENLNGLTALVVDDNPANRDAIRALLSPLNPNLIYADNGREAITALNMHLFDYIIMDIHMPGLSGIQTTELIREKELGEYHIPIIGLTADSTQNTKQIAFTAGMDSLLTKPVTSLALFQAIENSRTNNPHYKSYIDKARRQGQA